MIVRYSMIDAFLECPMKYYRRYVLNLPSSTSSPLEYGQAIHAAIRGYLEDEDGLEIFKLYWNSIRNKDLEYYRFSWDDLNDLALNKFLPNFKKYHSNSFSDYTLEQTLSSEILPGVEFQGTYDYCGGYKNTLTMTDWKTSTREYDKQKILKNPQMWLYCWLYQHKYGMLPEQVMYKVFVKSKSSIQTIVEKVSFERISLHLENTLSIIKNMIQLTETTQWYSNYNCRCQECL